MTSYEQAAAAWVKSTYDLDYEPTDVFFELDLSVCGDWSSCAVRWRRSLGPDDGWRVGHGGYSDITDLDAVVRGVYEQGNQDD